MTNSSRLERRYRSLLALYPKAFRREHEQEILSVLMAAALEARRALDWLSPPIWSGTPSLCGCARQRSEGADLMGVPTYPSHAAGAPCHRCLALFLTAILYGYGRGGWWGALLVPAATLHFYNAYRLIHRSGQAPGTARREGPL